MVRRNAPLLAVVGAVAFGGGDALAHPHVFVEYAVRVGFGEQGPTSLKLRWTFDQMYSALLIGDFVKDPEGPLPDADIRRLRDNAFANVANYHYFLEAWLNRRPVKIGQATAFDAGVHDHRVTYEFTVPIETTAARGPNELAVVVFDQEYYVEFSIAKSHPVTVEHADGFAVTCMTYPDADQPSELAPVSRDIVRCTWRH